MSDNWIRLIPTDATWVPEPPAAEAATTYVRSLFAPPAGSSDEVTHTFHRQVAVIDSGVNTASVTCSECGTVTDVDWVFEVVSDHADDFGNLEVSMPCCEAGGNLNDLDYDWPMGFVQFEIEVMNGSRDRYELDPAHTTVAFLVASQTADGNWTMTSRPMLDKPDGGPAKNLLPITSAGTAWAALGLVRATPRA